MSEAGSDLSTLFQPEQTVSLKLSDHPVACDGVVVENITSFPSGANSIHQDVIDGVHGRRAAPPMHIVIETPEAVATWGPMDDLDDAIGAAVTYDDGVVDADVVPPELSQGECARVARTCLRDWKSYRHHYTRMCKQVVLERMYNHTQPKSVAELKRIVARWRNLTESVEPHKHALEESRDNYLMAIENSLANANRKTVAVARGGLSAFRARRDVIMSFRKAHVEIHQDSMKVFWEECKRVVAAPVNSYPDTDSGATMMLHREAHALRQAASAIANRDADTLINVVYRIEQIVRAAIDAAIKDKQAPKWYRKWFDATSGTKEDLKTVRDAFIRADSLLLRTRAFLGDTEYNTPAPDAQSPSEDLEACVQEVVLQIDGTYKDDPNRWLSKNGAAAAAELSVLRESLFDKLREALDNIIVPENGKASPGQSAAAALSVIHFRLQRYNAELAQAELAANLSAAKLAAALQRKKSRRVLETTFNLDRLSKRLHDIDAERITQLNSMSKRETQLTQALKEVYDTLLDQSRRVSAGDSDNIRSLVEAFKGAVAHSDLYDTICHIEGIGYLSRSSLLQLQQELSPDP